MFPDEKDLTFQEIKIFPAIFTKKNTFTLTDPFLYFSDSPTRNSSENFV